MSLKAQAKTARHNSMINTIPIDGGTTLLSQDLSYENSLINAKNPQNLTIAAKQSMQPELEHSPTQVEKSNKLQSLSLELRRRTDQQSNYLSRTFANWKNTPIGVED